MMELSPQQLKEKIDGGSSVTLVDIRPDAAYQEKHIPGAMSVPGDDGFVGAFQAAVPDWGTDVVLYNDFKEDESDKKWAHVLESAGYKHLSVLPDGIMGWMNAGYQVEFGRES